MLNSSKMKNSVLWLLIFFITLFSILPIIWMVLAAFKTQRQMFAFPPVILPPKLYLGNFKTILTGSASRLPFLLNSLIVSFVTTLVVMLLATPTAYGFARMKIRGSENVEFWILSTRMMPPIAVLIPIVLIIRNIGMFDSLPGLILPYIAFNLPYAVWMLIISFKQLPIEIEEAAVIDGCGWGRIFFHIATPLILPTLMTVAMLVFIFSWNELLFALVLTGRAAKTLPVAVSEFAGGVFIRWELMAAASTLQIIPAVIVVTIFQRHIVSGLTLGAVEK